MNKFAGPWLKMIRAAELAKELDSVVGSFLDSKPHSVSAAYDAQTTEYAFRVHVRDTPPPIIGLLAGETAHAMRSALDYAIGELIAASADASRPPRQNFAFPIFETPAHYAKVMRRNDGLPVAAVPILEGMQPYNENAGRGGLLWQLHRLDIEDKHRQLVASAGGMAMTPIGWSR